MATRPAIWLVLLLALPVSAQETDPTQIERTKILSVKAATASVKPGETFHLVFKILIDPNWHIYSANGTYAPTEWTVEGPFERAGKVEEPQPKHHRVSLGKGDDGKERFLEYDYHEGDVTFRVPVKATAAARPGLLKVRGKITGQECDPSICIGIDLGFSVDVTVSGERTAGVTTPPPADGHTKIESVTADPANVKVGETFRLVFKVAIEPNWHIYSVNSEGGTAWEFDVVGPVESAGQAEESKTRHKKDEFNEYDYHEGEATFRVPVRLKAGAKPGPLTFYGKMIGQECDPKVCIPFELPFPATVTVVEGGVAAPAPPPTSSQDTEPPAGAPKDLLGLLLLGVIGGLVSLVMPCVYPLLPITLTYFIKQGGESRAKSVAMSTAYSLGIIIVFTGVGFLFSVLLGAEGPRIFAASPWVNIAVALLFFWFAFSLFGLYEITLPSWLTGSLTGSPHSGVGGAFILGALFSIVTFTCTIPIAATILSVAASSGAGNRFSGLMAMLVYSATMAAPFFVLGVFPSLLKDVPKSGGWLHTVKVTAGFAELALALLYMAKADQVTETNILTRPVMIAIWIAVLAFMALYLLGVFRMKGDDPPGPVGLGRTLIALTFGVVAVFMGTGFNGKALGGLDFLLPARPAEGFQNLPDALAEAKETKKPLFVEFTGYT